MRSAFLCGIVAVSILAFPLCGCAAETSPTAAAPVAETPQSPKPVDSTASAPTGPTTPVEQPKEIPGRLEIAALPLPDADKIVAQPSPGGLIYGLYTWAGEYKIHRESIRKVGWKSFRIGGPFDDEIMKMVVEDNVEVLKTLGRKKRSEFETDEAFIASSVAEFEEFLKRYGPKGSFFADNPSLPHRPIKFVEIWNEPNFQYMIPDREPRAEVEAEREALYPKLLAASYRAIKAQWPEVTVVGFGAGGASAGDLRFIKNIHQRVPEIVKSYDILSTHPYSTPEPPDAYAVRSWGRYSPASSLASIRETMAAAGAGGRPIWYTEVGWPISKADGGFFDTEAGAKMVSPTLQAAYVCRMYATALRLGVDRVHIMFATDSDRFNAGFFLRDKSWRPSAHAAATMIKMMPAPKLSSVISDGADGCYAYVFTPSVDKNDIIMAWNVQGPKEIELADLGDYDTFIVTDMLGQSRDVKAIDGKIKLTIGPAPVYISVPPPHDIAPPNISPVSR